MSTLSSHCLVPDCERRTFSRDLCHQHYKRLRQGQIAAEYFPMRSGKSPLGICRYLGCDVLTPGQTHCDIHSAGLQAEPGIQARIFDGPYSRYQPCAVEGCSLLAANKRLCKIHLTRATNFGIDADRFLALLAVTHCEICGREAKSLHIDHDHGCCSAQARSCGKCIRGMICRNCNMGLGLLQDNADVLEKAAAYLRARNVSS